MKKVSEIEFVSPDMVMELMESLAQHMDKCKHGTNKEHQMVMVALMRFMQTFFAFDEMPDERVN